MPPISGKTMVRARGAFTIVELLVVVVIITILISAVLVASTTLVARAKVSATQAVLAVVRDAVGQFEREQAAPRNDDYRRRYGTERDEKGRPKRVFPPDELEVFTKSGVPGAKTPMSLAVGKAEMIPKPASEGNYPNMKFYTQGLPVKDAVLEHRDLVAMVLGIQEWGDTSAQILGGIQDRYWVAAPLDEQGKPAIFLDRPGKGGALNGVWDEGDLQIRYIVDDWGVPISYMAQRDWVQGAGVEPSSNHPAWNKTSTRLVRLNGGQPIIMSYGPDGEEQLTAEAMGDKGAASLVGDSAETVEDKGVVDHFLNADNIYADPALKQKMAKGIP